MACGQSYQYDVPAYDRYMRQFRLQGFSYAIGCREFVATAGAILSACLPVFAAEKPKQILIIRHAEKNDSKSDIHLNAPGDARAAALPTLFPSRFDTLEFLFASRQSAPNSMRRLPTASARAGP
jgi:hypothetical protein